jgi:hypothetical protein
MIRGAYGTLSAGCPSDRPEDGGDKNTPLASLGSFMQPAHLTGADEIFEGIFQLFAAGLT